MESSHMTTGVTALSESPQTLNPHLRWEGTGLTILRAICTFFPLISVGDPLPLLWTSSLLSILVVWRVYLEGMLWSWRRFFFRMYHPTIHFLFLLVMHWGSQGFCSESTGPGWTRGRTEKLLFMLTPAATALTTAPLCCPDPNTIKSIWICPSLWLAGRGPAPGPQTNSSLDPSPGWASIMHQPLPANFIW